MGRLDRVGVAELGRHAAAHQIGDAQTAEVAAHRIEEGLQLIRGGDQAASLEGFDPLRQGEAGGETVEVADHVGLARACQKVFRHGAGIGEGQGRSHGSDPLDDRGGPHAGRNAERGKAGALAGALKLVQQGADDHRAGCAQWVTHRNRAAIDVDLFGRHV